ncbi:hypothetical protein EBT16_02905 [bacterium]|nr:hypothetical protein [bacterium]
MINRKLLFFALLFHLQNFSPAAPCCGGTANIPSLISGDDSSQFTATFSSGRTVAEAPVDGGVKYRKDNDRESSQTLRLDGAMLLSDRTQASISLPFIRKSRSRGNTSSDSMGLGDVGLNLGYEALPEWSYNSWQPRALCFVSATLPTGRSLYDAKELYNVDSRGRGFWTLSSGVLFLKMLGNWDFSLLLEGHRSFSREIENDLGILKLIPGWGGSGLLALGVSPGAGDLRLGLSLSPSFEQATQTEGVFSGKGESTKLWTAAAQISYLVDRAHSLSLVYSDQLAIQVSKNVPLNRTLALLFQTRWER